MARKSIKTPDNWRRGLPFKLEEYDKKTQLEIKTACQAVLEQVPVSPPLPEPPNYKPVENPKELPNSLPSLIGIFGDPQAGKDVVVDYIVAHYRDVRRMSFSDMIFPEVNAYLALHPIKVNGEELRHVITHTNKTKPFYRKLLQVWGLVRDPNLNYWAGKVREQIKAFWDSGARLVIITGVRLPPEISMIGELNGKVWKVVRPNNPYKASHAVESLLNNLPLELYREISNPVEGNIQPFEKNIRQALDDH